MFPCSQCCKLIASSGISKVIYIDSKYENDISKKLLHYAEVKFTKFGV